MILTQVMWQYDQHDLDSQHLTHIGEQIENRCGNDLLRRLPRYAAATAVAAALDDSHSFHS